MRRRPQFSLKTMLWVMLGVALASAEVPRLWRAFFPPQRLIEFTFATTLDDGSVARYDLYEDGTYAKELIAAEDMDGAVPPAAGE